MESLRLSEMIGGFSKNTVEEIDSSKGTSDEWVDLFAIEVDLGSSTTVCKDIMVSKLYECKLTVIGMSTKVLSQLVCVERISYKDLTHLHTMQTLT